MKKDYPTVRGPIASGIKLDENVYMTMRDGVKIAVDIFRPEAEGRYPALLSMAPYIKEIQQQPPELSHDIEAGATDFFVPKGYVHIVVQIRGTGFSQGQYDFLDIKQQQDGYDIVEWAAQQPWCNGNVGMMGDSYFSMIQYLVAAQQPPHLKCIAPLDGCTDPYRDFCYRGGLFNTWFLGMWGSGLIRQCLWPGPVEGKLPPANLFLDWATNAEDGPYYWERAAWTKLDKIKVPMLSIVLHSHLHIGGQLYAYPLINTVKKLLITPPSGIHANSYFLRNRPLQEQILRWFDYWLKGIDTGIMDEPEVAIFDSPTREWRYENEYPLARTNWTRYYLRSNETGPSTEPPYGLMSLKKPVDEKPDTYMTPQSWGLVAAGKPVLAYSTQPLEKDLRVWGPLSAVLYGSTTSRDTAWFLKLGDMDPDGKVTMLTAGHLKASFREVDEAKSKPGLPFHPFQKPVLPEPNKVHEYQIELWPIFYTFKSGHKIWLQIASIDFAYQMNIHAIYSSEILPVPAENTIYHDSKYLSHLFLPVIPDAPEIKPVGPHVSQINWEPEFLVF
ncbi:CocE/NonD family hydrolase [Chloroflexota bacterium]